MSTQLSSYQALDEFYIYKDRATVYAFLEQNPFLLPILLEAYSQITTFENSSAMNEKHPLVRVLNKPYSV